jgi:hypothetical protein
MLHKEKINDPTELRKFSIGLAVLLLLITAYIFFKYNSINIALPVAAGLVLIIGLTLPKAFKPVFIIFSYFGFGMNRVVTQVILFLLFFGIFTPTGLIMRLLGKKFLSAGFDRKLPTYWISRPEDQRRDGNFGKQF